MASTNSPLSKFLDSAKHDFLAAVNKGEDLSNWVVCTGNEAGDLDSLASSLAFSYFSSLTLTTTTTSPRRHIPLLQTHSTDLYLRPENLFALSSSSLSPSSSLLCIDEIPTSVLRRSPSKGGPHYALVDHNVLLPSLRADPAEDGEAEEEQVAAILDHHADEGAHLSASPRTIIAVGSCVSLVVQHFLSLSSNPSLAEKVPQGLADLILSSLLIDTSLKPSTAAGGGKATAIDLAAVDLLLPFASASFRAPPPPSISAQRGRGGEPYAGLLAVGKVLGAKKFDVAHLGGRDLLRRDYKEYELDDPSASVRYGLSTVPLPLSAWLAKTSEEEGEGGKTGWELVLSEVEAWKAERGLQMAAILTSFDLPAEHPSRVGGKKNGGVGKHARELMVHVGVVGEGGEGRLLKGLLEGLESEGSLQLAEWRGGAGGQETRGGEGWRVWQQGNVKATRKQVAPVIKALIQGL